ncbi:hypothetical protein OTU49_007467, partial [Cherax quadricarinatus]
DLGRPPQPYLPERYILLSPEESFLRELLLHSATPAESRPITDQKPRDVTSLAESRPITGQKLRDVTSLAASRPITSQASHEVTGFAFPQELDRMEFRLPSVDLARLKAWTQQQQHNKPKRLQQQPQLQHKQRTLSVVGFPVAQKKWWGGGHHRRGEIARRASQNKHLDCLKSCIKQGTLHPIQCHTLC